MQIRKALVTGGAARLGRAIALALAEDGFDVAVHFNSSADAARATAGEIRAMGRTASVHQADLLENDAVEALMPAAASALGAPISVLVNNASVFEYDRIDTATPDSWDRHIGSNLRAPFFLTQAFAAQVPDPVMDENGEPIAQGLIVNMLDQRMRKSTPEFATYTIAKMGLAALTQTAAQGLAPRVRVNAIGPGPTVQGHRQSDDHFARQRAATILKRGSNPQDVVGALRYFLNAPGVTGQYLAAHD